VLYSLTGAVPLTRNRDWCSIRRTACIPLTFWRWIVDQKVKVVTSDQTTHNSCTPIPIPMTGNSFWNQSSAPAGCPVEKKPGGGCK